ncbi:histone deacetylase family protein [bacterium]|nr:histone deacetylase family protein [bacterium]
MFRIRRIHDDVLPVNREAVRQAQQILRDRIPDLAPDEFDAMVHNLRDPFAKRFRAILHVAEKAKGEVLGFALVLHEPALKFFYLDFIAAKARLTSRGIGGALYQRVREEALECGVQGIFFECLPDEPGDCADKALLAANRARLRFYEHYGARPLVANDYTRPLSPDSSCMPYLVVDTLGGAKAPSRRFVRAVARAILERKYRDLCPPDYVEAVVDSFRDDPCPLRPFRYTRGGEPEPVAPAVHRGEKIALFINESHDIHHVSDRGYVEAPVRVRRILAELDRGDAFEKLPVRERSLEAVRQVHDRGLVAYIRKVCGSLAENESVYPYVFPIRNAHRPPTDLGMRAGYYCIDTFTPLNRNAFLAARGAVDCALAGADALREGRRLAYALVRPPGHHAEHRVFGGFCYFNNAAVAAQSLAGLGRVAILDLDYHHGNGQQDIFYAREDVLTVSIHGHPSFAYPYFSGFAEEQGEGAGRGFNLNLPLPEAVDGERYREALGRALRRIRSFAPATLVVALGLDTAKGDPTGTWSLAARDFLENGRLVGGLHLPTLVVQEGGYRTRTLGTNADAFFTGLLKGTRE